MKQNNPKAYFFLILCTLFWSGNFIVGKVATFYSIPPFTLNFYRWFIGFILLAPFTIKEVLKNKKIIKKNFKVLLIMGFTSISIFNSVVYYSLNLTQVLNGVLMISTIPVLIILIARVFRTEKIKPIQYMGVLISFVGVSVIITKMELERLIQLQFNKGDLWMLVAMLSWAVYSIMIKRNKINLKPFVFLETIILLGLIFLLPMYLYEIVNHKILHLNVPVILTISYVVVFAGIGAYFFWNEAVQIIGAAKAGVFLHLMPVFSSLMAIFILKEKFANFHIVGIAFIVVGIILSSKKLS